MTSLLSLTAGFWLPILLAWAAWAHYRRIRDMRRLYYTLPPSERELIVKSVLFLVHAGAVQTDRNQYGQFRKPADILADILDLPLFTVDEALRRLIHHGYAAGVCPGFYSSMVPDVQTSPRGREFYEAYYQASGDVYNVAPWGTVISRSTMTDTPVGHSTTQVILTDPAPAPTVGPPRESS